MYYNIIFVVHFNNSLVVKKINKTINASQFTPFVVTADGALGLEAKTFSKNAFCCHRAANLCIRGSRVKWRRRMEIEDGAGLPYLPE